MKMKFMISGLALVLLWSGAALSNDLNLVVFFEQSEGLKKGDRVLLQNVRIGEVEDIKYTNQGMFDVFLVITWDYRPDITDMTKFVIGSDPLL